MAVSNNITALLNFISFLCSIPILASGIWLASNSDTACVRWLRWPLLSLGSAALLVSLSGFLGAYYRKRGLLSLYLLAMAALIVSLLLLVVLASIVTRPGGGYAVPARAYREYRLEGYPNIVIIFTYSQNFIFSYKILVYSPGNLRYSRWLRDNIVDDDHWGGIRACLAESDVCAKMSRGYFSARQFFVSRLSPIESGCCKPPTICGYQFVNPTMWVAPINAVSDPDCLIWNNDPTQLCYNCDSCRAGFLGNLRSEWRKAEVALIVAVVVLIFVYLIACNAYKNTQLERSK